MRSEPDTSPSDGPLISVITPSFNQGVYIERTIQSVLRQAYQPVQHIVIDGGSTDNTVEVLRRYPHLTWVSEADRGQSDALNKGLNMATGEIIGWINSDDYYHDNIFASVAAHFRDARTSWVVGNLANLFEDGSEPVFRRSPTITFEALARGPDIVRQQSTFFRRQALISVGAWNVDRYMAMDYDLWMKLARVSPPRMVDENWAYFRNHTAQKSGYANIMRQSAEIAAVMRRENVASRLIASHRLKIRWYWLKGMVKERLIALGIVPQRYRNRSMREE
jgi:glycosyltransferase involved in cell wall biosynthesis